MDSPPTSSLRFLDLDGKPIASPEEWAPAFVEVLLPVTDLRTVTISRQGVPLPPFMRLFGNTQRLVADWPRSGPGNYRISLKIRDLQGELLTTIWPSKLSRAAFAQLLEDLEKRLPAAVALGLQRTGGLVGLRFFPAGASTLSQELELLRRAVCSESQRVGLDRILPEVGRDPHRALKSVHVWTPREKARRPNLARVVEALVTSSHNFASEERPLRVIDTRSDHELDVYENRLIRTFCNKVMVRLRRLLLILYTKQ